MAGRVGEWAWSNRHFSPAKIISVDQLWDREAAHCWLPVLNATELINVSSLIPIAEAPTVSLQTLIILLNSTRIKDTLQNDPYAPIVQADLIPLPHQLKALHKATDTARTRFLLADEVGLGKTIEAGMIHAELKRLHLVKRTLIIAPKGLTRQWIDEMKTRFNETFHLINPTDPTAPEDDNPWNRTDQAVSSLDSVKPISSRSGWTNEKIVHHNQRHFQSLIDAGWDLIIVDEAHKLPGSTLGVARYELATALSNSAPYLLLLSATPHQGKTDQFRRLIQLLDPETFENDSLVTRETVQPLVIRTEKRQAITTEGDPLFTPRTTQLIPVSWSDEHSHQRRLYQETTEYIREGYNNALQEKRNYIGFLMTLMQKLVSSSTRAISETLMKRLEALEEKEPVTELSIDISEPGQQRIDDMLIRLAAGLKDEREQVRRLTELAQRCEASGPDARAEALINLIYQLRVEEGNPHLKVLVFTEFLPTQRMLKDLLTVRGFEVTLINGSMDLEERLQAQRSFAASADTLISTEAGGEGINLQFCHIVVNYDLPWNPMRIEQRIGRIDRIGQKHSVRVFNLTFNNSIEHRIQEVLEQKLEIILHEFGVDKLGDVLDSTDADINYDRLYMETLLHPDRLEENIEEYLSKLRQKAKPELNGKELLRSREPLDTKESTQIINHPLKNWMEHINEKDPSLHNKAGQIPTINFIHVPGMPIPSLTLDSLSAEVRGYWSLWRLTITCQTASRERVYSIFIHDDGRSLTPTANQLWDTLLRPENSPQQEGVIRGRTTEAAYYSLREEATKRGKDLLGELEDRLQGDLNKQREKERIRLSLRRRSIQDIPDAKDRADQTIRLKAEEEKLNQKQGEEPTIQLQSIIIIHVRGTNG